MKAKLPFTDVPGALEEFKAGRMIVVVDDEDRENEGDLTLAAEFVTPEAINFMAKHGRGLICLSLTEERADYLRLGPMTQQNSSRFGTAFTETIEAREGVTTGISAHDRAHTIQVAINPGMTAADLARPGHVFPLRARRGGVLVRAGQTEASVDLARMAGLIPAGVICEIMNDDGTMARVPDLIEFCKQHQLKMLTVAELIRFRLQNERYIFRVAESIVPTRFGDFRMIALCDCHQVVQRSLEMIAEAGRGALVYLHNTSKGFEIDRSITPHRLFLHREERSGEHGEDRHQRILRQVGLGGQILSDLNIRKIRLLSNTRTHVPALQGFDLEIVDQVGLVIKANPLPV